MLRTVDPRSRSRTVLTAMLVLAGGLALARAQTREEPPKNPFQSTPGTLQEGMVAFRANCAYCHGMDGRGARGPDLTGIFGTGRTEETLYPLVRAGVPGTEMPPASVFLQEPDTWKVLMYIRTLGVPPSPPLQGNAENGERLFRTRCASCHRVNGHGGVVGPDLSRIGGGRTSAALTRQIRGAVEDFRDGYEPVTVTTNEGRTVRGTRKGEDLFSVQVMDTTERLQGYVKSDVKAVTSEKRSIMPAYSLDQLNQQDLNDLLVYLSTLRGTK